MRERNYAANSSDRRFAHCVTWQNSLRPRMVKASIALCNSGACKPFVIAVLCSWRNQARLLKNLSWSRVDVAQGLVVGDALFDPRHELRRAALHHLPNAGPKLVQEVNAHVGANRRAKSFEGRRSGARPIWTVSGRDRDRSQHPEEIRRVQCRLAGVVPRD